MRKTAIFILAITLCALLSGCGKAMTISLPFAASDVENVEMYHYVVPTSAEKKIITQADAISGTAWERPKDRAGRGGSGNELQVQPFGSYKL